MEKKGRKDRPWKLFGFWEEAYEPIARTDKESFLGFRDDCEPDKKSLDFGTKLNWVLEKTHAVAVDKLKLEETMPDQCLQGNKYLDTLIS